MGLYDILKYFFTNFKCQIKYSMALLHAIHNHNKQAINLLEYKEATTRSEDNR